MTLRARRTSADVCKKAAPIEIDAAFLMLRAETASLTAGSRRVFFLALSSRPARTLFALNVPEHSGIPEIFKGSEFLISKSRGQRS